MKLGELLGELNHRGLEIGVDGEHLRLRGPRGAVDAALRAHIERHKPELLRLLRARTGPDEPPLTARPDPGPAPLTPGQQGLWFLDRLTGGGALYNLGFVVRIRGAFDDALFERALLEIVRRHEVLRTRFVEIDGAPAQVVDPEPRVDHRRLAAADLEGDPLAVLAAACARPFDLARGPLLRTCFVELGPREGLMAIAIHHIVADEWSRGVLMRELAAIVPALAAGRPSPLPPLPLQFRDYARWQRETLRGETLTRLVDWWRATLVGAPPTLELPYDHPRPPVRDHRGAELRRTIDPATTAALAARCRACAATPFMGVLAAFHAFLFRISGQTDLVLGTNTIHRERRELAPLIGFFVDNLVLRVTVDGALGFDALLDRVRARTLDALAHQDLPFELLVEQLAPARVPGCNPLFQVALVWSRPEPEQPDTGEPTMEPLAIPDHAARFDLTLFIGPRGDALDLRMVHALDLLTPETAAHWADAFLKLLSGLVAEPERPLADLPLLTPSAAGTLQRWSQAPARPPQKFRDLHAWFEATAAAHPDAPALIDGPTTVTYAALAARSRTLAGALQRLGVGPGRVVAVALDRSAALLAALLAVLACGAAFLALDPGEPPTRMRTIIADARPVALIAHNNFPLDLDIPRLDPDTTVPTHPFTPPTLDRDTLAYLIYTSGTTGRPKGTEVCQGNIVDYLEWAIDAYEVAAGHGSALLGSLAFDGTLTSLFAPLLAGRPLHLLPPGRELERLCAADWHTPRLSFLKMTPAQLDAVEQLGGAQRLLARTRVLVLGGEALHGRQLATWRRSGADTRIVNEYGPTEITVACTAHFLAPGDDVPERVPIGRPIVDAHVHVVDANLRSVPIAVPGELLVGGPGLARGYLGLPELTADRFIADPFTPGARLYRTGDRVRWRPDGLLEFLGRVDDQLEIRGHRVEPGEVEAALLAHPAVEQAAVALRPLAGRDTLVAWLVLTPDATHTPDALATALREHLRARVPATMIPGHFEPVTDLPRSRSGKLDRPALPAPAAPTRALARGPATGETRPLQACFAALLGVADVGPDDDFFALGGHSLLAIALVARVRERLGVELPLAEVFAAPTPRLLAARVAAQRAAEAPPPLPDCVVALRRTGRRRPLFCVHPAAGSPGVYLALTANLDADQPVYGFQAPGLLAGAPVDRVDALAARYVDAMRRVQPRGPYRLLGWSFGAVVVCEMARQLERHGEAVDLLALVDGGVLDPALVRQRRRWLRAFAEGARVFEVLAATPWPRTYDELRHAATWVGMSLPETGRELLRPARLGRFVGEVGRTLRVSWSSYAAERRQLRDRPGPWRGRAVLFRAGEVDADDDLLLASVAAFARGGVEVRRVPGDHMSVMMNNAHVASLARELAPYLAPQETSPHP